MTGFHAQDPADAGRIALPLLLLAQFLIAAAGLVVEIVAGRMLAPYVGMSLYTWTAVIAVVLAGFSAGHWLGGLYADRPPRTALLALTFAGAFGAITTVAALPLVRLLSAPVLGTITDPVGGIVILTGLLFFLPSLAAGIPSPILARLAIIDTARSGRALGALHAVSAIGAIAGTLAAGYLFIAWLGTSWTLITVAAIYAGFAVVCLLAALRRPGEARARAATLTCLAGLLALGAAPFLTGSACTVESRYYCIRSLDISGEIGAPARLMVIDHLGHGINVLGAPKRLEMPYTAVIDALARERFGGPPDSAYFIGGGALTLPRAWSADAPRPGLIVAEIDPEVTRIAARDFDVDPSRFTLRHADARAALRDTGQVEAVIGDAFTDIAVPAHLVTREFYAEIAARLTPDGVYLMNLIDHMDRLHALAATVRTLKTVFPVVEVWIEAEDFASGGRTTFVLSAGSTPSPQSRILLPPTDADGTPRILGRIPQARIDALVTRLDPPVLTDDYAPIARLIGPAG
ncbi:fused MFS/spermidine synthase [Stappia indica]|uniref:fused MFS/spermidine synthase n=1 Tax=Stappia indica TaxID=538381 RepID=UPI001CD75ADD|nr:fused MFS/spermidine synthase [Stappia indica]MCA1299616.1 fused MFS/spermidine synthase [Stappia indica]